ncbi:MAG: hypothetical protein ACYDEU_02110 [Vulcanimicrobiaceae bacterium]
MFDPVDERGVPISRGIPKAVRMVGAIGVIIIFAIGTFVIVESHYGHIWPSTHSMRVRLGTYNGT